MKLFFLTICLLTAVVSPQAVFAQSVPLINPLTGMEASESGAGVVAFLQEQAGQLLGIMFGLLGALSILPVVVGGIMMAASQGNQEMVDKGKKTLSWGIIGLVVGLSGIGIYFFFLRLALGQG